MLQSRYIETKNPGGFGEMEDIGADAFANAPCVQIVADPLLHHVKGQDGAAGVGGAEPLAVLLVIDAAGIGTGGRCDDFLLDECHQRSVKRLVGIIGIA